MLPAPDCARGRRPSKVGTPRAPRGKKGKLAQTLYTKVTFSMARESHQELFIKALNEIGGQRKVGTAPRGALEREASKLLAQVEKRGEKVVA